MMRRDEGKASLVEFLRSLKYSRSTGSGGRVECPTRFARLEQRAPTRWQFSAEDSQLIRSAN